MYVLYIIPLPLIPGISLPVHDWYLYLNQFTSLYLCLSACDLANCLICTGTTCNTCENKFYKQNGACQGEVWAACGWHCRPLTSITLLAVCAGNSPVTGEFPTQRPVTRSFDVFFDLRLNERLRKKSRGWWFETPSRPLWRHSNDLMDSISGRQCLLFCADAGNTKLTRYLPVFSYVRRFTYPVNISDSCDEY